MRPSTRSCLKHEPFTRTGPIMGKLLITLASTLISALCSAQEVEEVVIQGQQVEDTALDDFVSVAVIDAGKLADAGIENVEDVAAYVPNLVLSETSTGTNIVIRGIGAGTNQGFDQSVGLYIDGVPLPRSQMARAPFLDLAGVQVLRGPQYVKDGNYSIAGSIHMLTQQANDEFKLAVDTSYIPSQNDRKLLVTLATPIAEWGGMRLAMQQQRSDGYIENVTRNEDGPQNDDLIIRGVFAFNPTENLNIKVKIEDGSFDQKGRQIEIIESQPTPDFRLFPEVQGPGGTVMRDAAPNVFIKTGQQLTVLPELRNPLDYTLDVVGSWYDTEYYQTGEPAFAGYSYLQTLENLYTDAQPVKSIAGFPTSTGVFAPPAGLMDSSVNFKRAADAAEFSENDSTNITINLDYWLGDHSFAVTVSDIDYEFKELIDTDFTPIPILETRQSERYKQQFYRFDYKSPADNFLEFHIGATYLESELEFDERIQGQFGGPTNQSEAEAFILAPLNLEEYYTFNPENPFNTYLSRINISSIRSLQVYSPDREFRSETKIAAAFFETTINLTDQVSAVFGGRYTRGKKKAIRDFAFLLKDGTAPQFPGQVEFGIFAASSKQQLASIYNFGEHSDRVNFPDRGFDNGVCENVISWALGGPCDPDPLNGPIDDETFLPSLSVNWNISTDLSVFASARMANKLAGFDARSVSIPRTAPGVGLQPGTFKFKDEDATTFELGTKWYLPNGWGQINATAFHTTFKNLQVSTADRSVGFNVRNAGVATSYGIEAEGLLQPTENFNINYSLAWIEFEFEEFPFGSCSLYNRPDQYLISVEIAALNDIFPLDSLIPIVYEEATNTTTPRGSALSYNGFGVYPLDFSALDPSGDFYNVQRYDYKPVSSATFCDFKGRTNQYVAQIQGTFSLNYTSEIQGLGVLKPTVDILYNSGYQTSVTQDEDIAQEAYFQFNGRLALASFDDIWEIAVVGKNLTNERIVGFASEVPIATRIQGSKTHFGFVRPPRSLGLNFRYNFY